VSSLKAFLGNELCEFSVPALHAACFAHIMFFLDVIAVKVFVEEYEL
jgi:hypothetical protein